MSAVYFVKTAADGASRGETVASALLAGGLEADTPVALIEWAVIAQSLRARTTLGRLSGTATTGRLVLVGEIPGTHDASHTVPDDRGVDGDDAFMVYGRSWFR